MWKGAVEWRGSGTIGTSALYGAAMTSVRSWWTRSDGCALRAADHISRMPMQALSRRQKPSTLHSLKDRSYYDRRSAPPHRHLIAATDGLIAASRELITHARPPELWPMYDDGPKRPVCLRDATAAGA
jgi:hypothetical protein